MRYVEVDGEPPKRMQDDARLRAATVNALKRKPKRIVLIGSTQCGKSALINRFVSDTFTTDYKPTIEECFNHQYTHKGVVWNLDIIDLCGPFMFPVMRDLNIKTAHIVLLVYEIGNDASIKEIVNTLPTIKELRPNGVTTLLVGTKIDLKLDREASIHYQVEGDLENIVGQGTRHIVTSAKTNIGVTDVFDFCLDDYSKYRPTSVPPAIDDVEKCRCCCTII